MAANTQPGFFRLIFLSPGQWDDDIRCTLLPFNRLQDGYPPYKALSYVWGRWSRNPPEILVNGRKVRVTTNLAVALRHLRHEVVDMVLWIDALCIDQSDTEERSSQVAQMRDIYNTAVEVIMFLGDGRQYGVANSNHSSRDLRPFQRFWSCEPDFLLASQYMDSWKTSPLKKPVQPLEVFAFLTVMSWVGNYPNPLGILEDIPEAHMAALAEALRRTLLAPWWDRIWVVQEAVVAKRLSVRYGNVAVPWEVLVGAAEVLSGWETNYANYPNSPSTADLKVFNLTSRITYLDNFRTQWFQSRGTNLLLLLRYFGSRRASDERDRVYALLGLCNEATLLRPDYSLHVAEVFMAPVLVAIRNTKSLYVLNGDHSRKGRQDIPSWVPDWSAEREEVERRRIELSSLYDASKGVRLLLMTENNNSVAESIRDDLASLLDKLKDEYDTKRLLREEYAPRLQDPRTSIFRSPHVGQEIQRICEYLARFCHKDGLRELPKYSTMIHSGQSLRLVGRKIGTVSKTTEPLYAPLDANSAAKVLGEWVKAAKARPLRYKHDDILKTIFSDMRKMPDGSLRRLQAGDIGSHRGRLVVGEDPDETLTPLFHDYDRFAEVIRLSTTKRAMFFMNDVDEFYAATMKSLDKQGILLGASEELLSQSLEREAHVELLNKHIKLISDARLLRHRLLRHRLLRHSRFMGLWRKALRSESAGLKVFLDDAEKLLNGRLMHFNQGHSNPEEEGVRYERDTGKHGNSTQLEYLEQQEFRNVQQEMVDEQRILLFQHREFINRNKQWIDKAYELDRFASDESFPFAGPHMGMGPMLMKEGDEVYILPGSRVPMVLRQESCCKNSTCAHLTRRYRLIGDCFIDYGMDGELSPSGFDILTINDDETWKEFNDGCGMRIYGSDNSAEVGSVVALEIV
ncbi:hypothetical protein CCMA1212_005341 [Trichoderma ghanense]|uniref:Heterokaryon incompatibility domain-containing protein n=1 Tax=Trichoderma ghanense TaxID=65468 RepID=A0ABY2H5G7_9HYPO